MMIEIYGTEEDFENLKAFTTQGVHQSRFPGHTVESWANEKESRWRCRDCAAGWTLITMELPEDRVRELVNRGIN